MNVAIQFLGFVLLALVVSTVPVAAGQLADFGNPEFDKNVRAKFVNSPQLPDSIAFSNTLRVMEAIHSQDPGNAYAWVSSNMGLKDDRATKFIDLMLSTKKALDERIYHRSRDIGCDSGVPRAVGEQVYSLLESMDDARDVVAAEKLVEFNKNLDTETSAKFQRWLDQRKIDIVHVKINHSEAFKETTESPDAVIAGLCNMFEQKVGGTPQ